MTNEVKEILIDLVDYYNVIGTEDDPGFVPFADIVSRASVALKVQHELATVKENKRSADVDPYAFDVVGVHEVTVNDSSHKHEEEL
jgi:hypothetical protein